MPGVNRSRLRIIKSIQRATITFAAATTATATITSVDTTKALLSHLGVVAGAGNSFTNDSIRLELTNATTVTATRAGASGTPIVGFEVIEYF